MDDLDSVDLHADVDRTFGPCGDPACPTRAPDDVANSVASENLGAVWARTAGHTSGEPEAAPAASRAHLRVVR